MDHLIRDCLKDSSAPARPQFSAPTVSRSGGSDGQLSKPFCDF
jgi:hypothetical protein